MAYRIDIEKATINNNSYRKVLFTTGQTQLVLMSLPPGDDIHTEIHPHTTQFIRVEKGTGVAYVSGHKHLLKDGVALVIPAGKRHYVKNTGNNALKLYTLYSPAEHPDGLVQRTNPDRK